MIGHVPLRLGEASGHGDKQERNCEPYQNEPHGTTTIRCVSHFASVSLGNSHTSPNPAAMLLSCDQWQYDRPNPTLVFTCSNVAEKMPIFLVGRVLTRIQ